MDQSELLSTLVVRGASAVLVVLLLRIALAVVLAGLARVTLDQRRARRLARSASRVAPRFARGAIVVVTGVGVVTAGASAATAEPRPAAVVTASPDRAPHVPLLDRGPTAGGVPPVTATTSAPTRSPRPAPDRPESTHLVRPGESLWSIAAARLGPHPSARAVAAAWPRWYAANRDLVGPDPSRIVPGQLLRIPAAESLR